MFLSLLVVLLAAPLHLHANANVSNYRATHEDLKGVLPQCKASVGVRVLSRSPPRSKRSFFSRGNLPQCPQLMVLLFWHRATDDREATADETSRGCKQRHPAVSHRQLSTRVGR
uniref:Putative secreted protein n=1 Tax=Ixodes ricinus TaxID=34613 RepID=A0A6B0UKR3_IXORI